MNTPTQFQRQGFLLPKIATSGWFKGLTCLPLSVCQPLGGFYLAYEPIHHSRETADAFPETEKGEGG